MFGSLGFPEILLILVLALLLFGPKRLPEIGRTIGKGLSEFRRASNELKRTLDAEVAADEAPRRPQPLSPAFRPPPRESEAEAAEPKPKVEAAKPEQDAEAAKPEQDPAASGPREPVEPA